MLDLLNNYSIYLSLLSLLTSVITFFSIGHVTTLALRLKNAKRMDYSLNESADDMLKRDLNLELAEGGSMSSVMNYVNMGIVGLGGPDLRLDDKTKPISTPPPSPPLSLPGTFLPIERSQPKPLSMAKLIMSRHTQKKTPPRPRIQRQQLISTTSLRRESSVGYR